jgi:hypothetical protein
MTEPHLTEQQKTITIGEWTWQCDECGVSLTAEWRPSSPYLCNKCRNERKQADSWAWFSEEYPELVGAKVVGGIFDGHYIKGVIVEATDGTRARFEIDRGWEGGDEELVVAWEDEEA